MNHSVRWTAKKIAQRLALIEPLVYRRRAPLPTFRYLPLDGSLSMFTHIPLDGPLPAPPIGPEVDDSAWAKVDANEYWGGWLTDFVLRTRFQFPADWPSDAPTALFLPLGKAGDFEHPEALAYIDGEAYATCDRHHEEILLPARWLDGQSHLLALHGWTGLGGAQAGQWFTKLFMNECQLVQIDPYTRDFIATARCALGIVNVLDDNEPAKGQLLSALDKAFNEIDTREPFGEEFYRSAMFALIELNSGIARCGEALNVDITAAGHAHIDVAWLWTLAQTRRKAGRTFHSVIRLMEQFPEYHFTQSQPQLYDFVRQDYPALFEAIQERVADGYWEPIGGMWVEADCNLSGPESLARQFLLGRTFFREHFGAEAEAPVLWLPDVFGYAWNLPQLIKQAGLDYFFTIKIGWSQYNRLPYDSFWWQGLDGTKVLTHFSTTAEPGSPYASTYNAEVTPAQVLGTWTNFKQKDLAGAEKPLPLLMAYGYGDGGGGPTREMLENLRALGEFPATPRITPGRVGEFFRRLEQHGAELPTWNGELYLELHRGTYTTQSRNKRANRQSEFLLHDAEFLATYAAACNSAYAYPAAELRKAWELVCLNQFHDIIPGSSIGPVYDESQAQYATIRQMAEAARDSALRALAETVGGEVVIVNPSGFLRGDLAFYPGALPPLPALTQAVEGGTLIDAGALPPFSVTPLTVDEGRKMDDTAHRRPSSVTASPTLLENDFLRVELNAAGDITRLYDKTNAREILPPESIANQLQAFEDRPLEWDAWDVDIFYDDKMWLADPATSVRVAEAGPLRATLEISRRILHSDFKQRISLAHNSARLDFDTTIDWRERHILLKAAFPVDVLSPVATYEIQWGNVQRPTHRNTSWDWARFETCAQKWVDLSEGGYGVSLLNDCKYGHDIHDNIMRLSLLRAPTLPDFEADQGEHRFAYSLFPHAGGWGADTVREAYALNDPLIVWRDDGRRQTEAIAQRPSSFVSASAFNVVIETIKRAEDGEGVMVRLYECQRRRGAVMLKTNFPVAEAWRTNLLEENQEALLVSAEGVALMVKPYEIVTLRLKPASFDRRER